MLKSHGYTLYMDITERYTVSHVQMKEWMNITKNMADIVLKLKNQQFNYNEKKMSAF